MIKTQKLIVSIITIALLYSCGDSSDLAKKKAKLEAYKKQLAELKTDIKELETEIAEQDTSQSAPANILVSTYVVRPEAFVHQIELRGSVASRKNVMISAETMGRIERIPVRVGQQVTAGTLLIKLDADILENNIAEVKTQLDLAETLFERQENLWKQNIGTEIQYLQAKNNKESLERKLETLNSQLSQAYVRAPFSGVVDDIPVKEGEMAQPGLPLVRVVNQKQMYIQADVPETYLGKVKAGDAVKIHFPTQDVTVESKVTSTGNVINQENRTFSLEASLSYRPGYEFRPNQVAILGLTDYVNENAISVPSKIIQSDEEGKYIYAMSSEGGKKVATKIRVKTGSTYNNRTEILAGLSGNERIIDKGYREVTDGIEVSLATASR